MEYVSLPSEYRQVEWLESTGTEYIDSGFIPKHDSRIVIVGDNNGWQFLVRESTLVKSFGAIYTSQNTFRSDYGSTNISSQTSSNFEDGAIVIVDKNKNECTISSGNRTISLTNTAEEFQCTRTFCLLANNTSSTPAPRAAGRIYSCKVWDNDTLIRNLIPCYRILDDKPGMYDLVSNTFFTNSGTGEFRMPPRLSMMAIRRRILANTPHVESVSGSGSVQFSTDMSVGLKEGKIYFTPIQEGSGTPSPDNERPITGWDGINITKNIGQDFYNYNVYAASDGNTVTKINDNSFRLYCTNKNYPASRQNSSTLNLVKEKQYLIDFDAQIDSIVEGHKCVFGFRNSSNAYQTDARVIIYTSGHYHFSFTFDNTRMSYLSLCEDSGQYVAFDATISNLKIYELETLTIPFPRTIYGGYLDLVRGEVVEEWVNKKINTSSFGSKLYEASEYRTTYNYFGGGGLAEFPIPLSKGTFLCDKLNVFSDSAPEGTKAFMKNTFGGRGAYIYIYVLATELGEETLNGLRNYVAELDPLFVYKPWLESDYTHIPLTDPPTIKTLKGINNLISSANGDIQISYFTHITT